MTLLCLQGNSQYEYYISEDRTYQLQIPKEWKRVSRKENTDQPIYLEPKASGNITPNFYLEISNIPKKMAGADIEIIAKDQTKKIINSPGYKPVIQSSEFTTINNHKWWKVIYKIQASTFESITQLFMTIYNNKIYTLKYGGVKTDFNLQCKIAEFAANSFMFYLRDNSDQSKIYNSGKSTDILKPYLGKYTFMDDSENGLFRQTIDISENPEGIITAIETRIFINSGKDTITFSAELIPEITNGSTLQLSSDQIIKINNSVNWKKAVFKITKVDEKLKVNMSSKNNAFEGYEIVMINENKKQNQALKSEKEKIAVNNSPKNIEAKIKTGLSCGNSDVETFDEKENIRTCGEGKISRIAKNTLQIKTNSKVVLLKDNESELDDGFKYTFIGKADDLKAFIIKIESLENNGFIVVNKTNGSQVFLPDLKYQVTKNGKFIASFQSDIINEMEESGVYIYSLSEAGLKQVFKQKTFTNGKGWGPSAIVWNDDKTLEIDKEVIANLENEETKPAGKTWLQLSDEKWIWKSARPIGSTKTTVTAPDLKSNQEGNGLSDIPSIQNNDDDRKGALPYVRLREPKAAISADALARAVLNAVKTNNKQAYYDLILKGTLEDATKGLTEIREGLKAAGVSNWNMLQYSRVKYSPNKNRYIKDDEVHDFVNIEFTYGKDFIGAIRGRLNSGTLVKKDGKYLLYNPLNEGGMFRKEEYR